MYKNELESQFDNMIIWERLDNKKASRIKMEMPIDEYKESGYLKERNWEPKIEWFRESMIQFYKVVYPIWEKVQSSSRR
jgi:hypothetical protein